MSQRSLLAMNNLSDVQIGCCGPGMAMTRYQRIFSVLEVQQTFYQPPRITTLEKWRSEANDEFEFVVKAWQLITHASTSPTYRRLKRDLSEKEKSETGSFRLTSIVKEALNITYQCAYALKSKTILFQSPKSFLPTSQNRNRVRRFFSSIDRPADIELFWEPRGDWQPQDILSLCQELNIFHTVDPFVNTSVTPQKLYFRLHGIGGYRYQYTNEQLQMVQDLVRSNAPTYVMFNNTNMINDAITFKNMLKRAMRN